jgi:hypothetical protein
MDTDDGDDDLGSRRWTPVNADDDDGRRATATNGYHRDTEAQRDHRDLGRGRD